MKIRETDLFAPIKLEEMEQVKLMNRTDTKYWFHASELHRLLEAVQDDYFILTMKNEVALPYSTIYYDTEKSRMFTAHHNGKLNRYKIRRRSYVSSGISFLEVKFKNNKGRTIKRRISTESNNNFSDNEGTFLQELTPFSVEDLSPSLINNFSRITLVNKNFKERCTIDFNLGFKTDNKQISLDKLVIVEIKSEGSPSASPLARALRNQRIKTSGFSKYCIGRTVTDSTIKRNNFKHKIRMIEKTLNSTNSLFNI
ncbi:polyphosphate polymerase domain-containing protein [Draconibacterium sp.]|uniref:polyphosphate polymerase domain-containing protein n=1 Tax=Draconibacterium sp. TaxID=1965318 RepID=UPI0029BFCBF5|nr:polyphosphate polymerase domain-containing protein [uncultured Draconibacterium sp.]